jgi:hypothetical protein
MLSGLPEAQIAQLRDYLVRLIGYIDESIAEAVGSSGQVDAEKLSQWQEDTEAAIGSLRASVKQTDLVQSGTAEAGDVVFPVKYKSAPVVIATAGTVSNVSSSGFTLSAAAQWIAAGR